MKNFSFVGSFSIIAMLCLFFTASAFAQGDGNPTDGGVLKLVPPQIVPPDYPCPNYTLTYNGTPPTTAVSTFFETNGLWTYDGPVDLHNQITIQGLIVPPATGSNYMAFEAERPVEGVMVYGSTNGYYYDYHLLPPDGATKKDTNLQAPPTFNGPPRITKVKFCIRNYVPTAAGVHISGRVVNQNGRGLPGITVTVISGTNGMRKTAITSAFGYYIVEDLEPTEYYIVSVRHKRLSFTPNQLGVTPTDNAIMPNFVSEQ